MNRRRILERIVQLDPEKDHRQIVFLDTCYEFPFDVSRALEFALYRTFAVPSIGALLDRTGEFNYRAQKRYDDTDLILSTILEYGYDSPEGRAAIRQMNRMHGRFNISARASCASSPRGARLACARVSTLAAEPIRADTAWKSWARCED